MAFRGRNRDRLRASYKKFLDQVQSNTGGYYEELGTERPVEFMRPLKCPFVRIRDMRSKEKRNVHFETLNPLNGMEVLAYMTWDDEDERRATGPETVETRTEDDEPQEFGDVDFIR